MLTIREAAKKTGHSPHRIRRIIKAIAEQPAHPDRSRIEPGPDDVTKLTAAAVQFKWRVDETLVQRELGDAERSPSEERHEENGGGEGPEWLAFMQRLTDAKEKAEERLFDQLRVKDEQLKAKDDQITALNERLRESNVLMASLQKQLPEPSKQPTVAVVTSPVPGGNAKRKGTAVPRKAKHWFGRLLRTR